MATHARINIPKDNPWKVQLFDTLQHESDRGTALVGAEILSDRLASLIKGELVDPEKLTSEAKKSFTNLFAGANQPLNSFAARTHMAYFMGLIEGRVWQNLYRVRKIRNEFAHNWNATRFTQAEMIRQIEDYYGPKKIADYTKQTALPQDTSEKYKFLFDLMIVEIGWYLEDRFDNQVIGSFSADS